MQFHRGRLIDHVHLRVRDLPASQRFYVATLEPLGVKVTTAEDHFQTDELWVDKADADVSHVHLAFQADGPEQVKAFYEAALAAGGRDNGAPGERPYHPGYYAAFVFDPDGNNIEAVFHGPNHRSADSVVIDEL